MNQKPIQFLDVLRRFIHQRGAIFTLIMLGALLAFEIFNYSTTDFALNDLLGNLSFLGVHWSTVLSIAFCGIDFAGIARLFTPEQGRDEPAEVWYLFGAWVLAAAMNATLTWWGVALALASHVPASAAIIGRATLNSVVPVFVALMVWIIRILVIGTFSMAGDRLIWGANGKRSDYRSQVPATRPFADSRATYNAQNNTRQAYSAAHSNAASSSPGASRPEPTYHPVAGMAAKPRNNIDPRS
jgi:hypothetical protein